MLGTVLYWLVGIFFATLNYNINRMTFSQRLPLRVASLILGGFVPTLIMAFLLVLGLIAGHSFDEMRMSQTYFFMLGTLPMSLLAFAAGLLAHRVWRKRPS